MIERRRAHTDDAAALGTLRAAGLIELGKLTPAQREPFATRAANEFARLLEQGRLVAWLLCADGEPVGMACANYFERLPFPEGTWHAEVSGVYVEPRFRRAGHASQLVAAVLNDVRTSPARKVFLRPSAAGRSLYARLGFVEDPTGVMSLPQ